MTNDEIRNFPCEDLLTIDRLWVKYSQGKFGFSVQKRIWVEVGGKLDFGKDIDAAIAAFQKMSDRNGWRVGGNYISYGQATFDTSAPEGHLPVLWSPGGVSLVRGMSNRLRVSSLASRIVKCKP